MPSFLYPNFREVSFDELPMGGLLRSPFVVRTLKHIYSGPRAATEATIDFKRNQAKLGCAARHGITKVTEEMIAYTVLLIRFCLSADDHWNRSEDGMRLEHFHRKVMSLFYGPLSKEVDDDDEEEATRWGYVGSASEDMTKEEYELVDRARTEWTKDLCDWYSQYLFGTQAVPKPARPIVRIDAPLTTAERLQQQIVARIRKEQQTAPQDASPDGSPALINLPSPVASGSSPVASGSSPVASGSSPVASGSSPLASGSSPVASGSSPVASSSTNRTALPCLTPPDASSSASTRSPPPPLGDVTQHEDVDNARSVQPKKGVRQNKPPPAARKRPANLNVTQRSLRNRIV
ncbi:hypothetical protein BD626DRAFT_636256 [Schizophyllum amplum]|uniref:Uncharacterized protein n=1 Tax=Schizophyllum amplum TaxID=97359 RepID=A0A550BTN6_9AGAR|nr:hypothetical protein BD626DRAFT_636256 [Auriculariopsis ampla]